MTVNIETDLKEILGQINQKLDTLQKDVTDINLRLTKLETKFDAKIQSIESDVKEIKGSQKAQIWTLIGILTTAVAGFLVAVGRLVFLSNP